MNILHILLQLRLIWVLWVRRGDFDPASSNLDIAGSHDGWTGTVMTDVDADTIYTAVLGAFEAGTNALNLNAVVTVLGMETEERASGGAKPFISCYRYRCSVNSFILV